MTQSYRRSLESRLQNEAARLGRDLNWLRRRHSFLRALHRLVVVQPDLWALKGGFAVELRRPGLARATRDVDLALRSEQAIDARDPRELSALLRTALEIDVDGDGFGYTVEDPRRMAEDSYGRPAWRFRVVASLAGKRFTDLRVDTICRPEELVGLVPLDLAAGIAAPAGAPVRLIMAADLRQQFAEKLHALTRMYRTGDSSRVKDLLDLVLLVEDGVRCDAELVRLTRTVFAVRQTHELPLDLGTVPVGWREPYRLLAEELSLELCDVEAAHRLVAGAWRTALSDTNRGTDT